MADRVIYKCTRQDENGNTFVSYAPTENYYQLDTIEVEKINFDANDWTMNSLCDALNNNIIED
tara:strand:- start:69 stop:257 length:189 start_codon:yes stop_codon:yes gene_type:complete